MCMCSYWADIGVLFYYAQFVKGTAFGDNCGATVVHVGLLREEREGERERISRLTGV